MSLKNHVGLVALTAIAMAVAGAQLRSQTVPAADLRDVKALKCTFSISSRAIWKDDVPVPSVRKTGLLTIDIKEIDAAAGSAVIGISSGTHDVTVQLDGRNLHFLEANRGGRIATTTVFADYSTGTRLKAVHSRADYLPIDLPNFKSEPEIAQYYGDCEATR
jgi:hypothetical protein